MLGRIQAAHFPAGFGPNADQPLDVDVVRSRFVAREPMQLAFRNIGIILAGLGLFAFVSRHVNMIAGITAMVFVAGLAGQAAYSFRRNVLISLGLVGVALVFQHLLGFNLPLY